MNRFEFIKLIIEKKTLDKEIFKKSLEVKNFPIARQILNKINGNINTDILLKSNNVVNVRSAQGSLIANLVNFLDDPLLKKETKKFIDDLVDQKLTGYSLTQTDKVTKKTDKKNQQLIDELRILREKRACGDTEKKTKNTKRKKDPNKEENDIAGVIITYLGLFFLFFVIPLSGFLIIKPSAPLRQSTNKTISNNLSFKKEYEFQEKTQEEEIKKCQSYRNNQGEVFNGDYYVFDKSKGAVINPRYISREYKCSIKTYFLDKEYIYNELGEKGLQIFTIEWNGNEGDLIRYVKYRKGGRINKYVFKNYNFIK